MSRRAAREVALRVLFQVDVGKADPQITCEQAIVEEHFKGQTADFCRELVSGALTNKQAIDELISAHSTDWKLERLANIDRNILRLAIFEIRFGQGAPASVVANEAVDLAKIYGDDQSSKFINGILGTIIRSKEEE